MKQPLFFAVSFFLLIWALLAGPGCANIIPPEGGPRDSIPPRLLAASPADSTLRFTGNRITLNFDEYVDLKEVQNNLLFLPLFQNNPEVQVKLRTVTVKFRDSLAPNTTYTLDFGNAITDINENNVFKNFTYTFSTGNHIDSLTLTGRVVLAQTGAADSTLLVELYKSRDDSAVIKERPLYVSRTDRNGAFHFHNLPADSFVVYALGGSGSNRRYQSKTQLFAFKEGTVKAGSKDSIQLYAYSEKPPTASSVPASTKATAAEKRLRFTEPGGAQDLGGNYTLTFTTPLKAFDSAKARLSVDSTFTPVDYTAALDTSKKRLSFHTVWREGAAYHLILEKDFAADTAGRQLLKRDTLDFSAKKLADYGELRVRIRGLDTARKPVLQFIQNNEIALSAALPKGGVFVQKLFIPGEYELRILYDRNGNGVWDAGSFFGTKKQPEIVVPLNRKINVKAAYENEVEATAP